MPIDYRESQAFRQLVEWLAMPPRSVGRPLALALADHIWTSLWRELGLKKMEGGTPGRLPKEDVGLFLSGLTALDSYRISKEDLLKQMQDPIKLVIDDDGALVCPRFANVNAAPINLGGRSREQRGGDMRGFRKSAESGLRQGLQLSLQIGQEKFTDEGGQPLDADSIKKVMALIISFDSALFKGQRPFFGYTQELIQNAVRMMKKYEDTELDRMIRCIALNRGHPALAKKTTDTLLPDLAETMGRLGAQY